MYANSVHGRLLLQGRDDAPDVLTVTVFITLKTEFKKAHLFQR
jgi:hypothetical protein